MKLMTFSKNQEIVLTIDDIGVDGEGIGHIDGYTFFVKEALPGETIRALVLKVNKNYGFAKMLELIEKSEDRVNPACEYASRCGGCTLMHLSYEKQLIYKEQKVKNCLVRIGGWDRDFIDSVTEPIIGMEDPYHYRNKAQFPVAMGRDGKVNIGFYAERSHNIIDSTDCHIQDEISCQIAGIVREWITKYRIRPYNEVDGNGLVRHIVTRVGYYSGHVMACLVVTKEKVPHIDELVEELKKISGMTCISLNINPKKTNKILGDKLINLYGAGYIEDSIKDIRFRISPLSFYQVNPVQTQKLYSTALSFAGLTGEETVWDMYCGIGTISLFLAQKAGKVLGIEIVPEAIEDAKVNAQINNIDNAQFICGASEDINEILADSAAEEFLNPDVIVVDPPRKGCDKKLIDTIIRTNPEKVVYVSCDPATLARDTALLREGGYKIEKVKACDMFGMSGHVETVCLLSR